MEIPKEIIMNVDKFELEIPKRALTLFQRVSKCIIIFWTHIIRFDKISYRFIVFRYHSILNEAQQYKANVIYHFTVIYWILDQRFESKM